MIKPMIDPATSQNANFLSRLHITHSVRWRTLEECRVPIYGSLAYLWWGESPYGVYDAQRELLASIHTRINDPLVLVEAYATPVVQSRPPLRLHSRALLLRRVP